jgi:hypothetical protein
MTSSSLIVFLPLVGAVAGGIVGAWANSWYRDRDAKKTEDRERKGLLQLITFEVIYNTAVLVHVLRMISDDATAAGNADVRVQTVSALRTEAWDKVMDRLARLLPDEDLDELNLYYGEIRLFLLYIRTPQGASAIPGRQAGHRRADSEQGRDNHHR